MKPIFFTNSVICFKIIILCILILLNNSCKNDNKLDITIKLHEKNINDFSFRSYTPLNFIDSIPNGIKLVSNIDSVLIGYIKLINKYDLKRLYKENKISTYTFNNTKEYLYALVGYNKENKQCFAFDFNQNYDFTDDSLIVFDKNFVDLLKVEEIDKNILPSAKLKINEIINGTFTSTIADVKGYPSFNYFGNKNFTEDDRLGKKIPLLIERRNYYLYGEFNIREQKYKTAVYRQGWKKPEIKIQEKDSLFYKPSDRNYSKYYVSDTIKLNQQYFKIDTLELNTSLLKLKPIDLSQKVYGYRIGFSVKNFVINDLKGKSSHIKELFNEKEFLLIDFWGTWCEPCKDLTTNLIDLNLKYGDKISLISLAFEEDPKPVIEYIKKNNMNWYNGFLKGKPKARSTKSEIIKNLKITCFPTFIILDKKLNIVYRTCGGGEAYENMLLFVSKL
tara:strand:+ start:85775 stop:87115 length:1341 start_codon:yes stop_codon:yes gene_type:complete